MIRRIAGTPIPYYFILQLEQFLGEKDIHMNINC